MKLIREFDDFEWADSSNLNGVKIKTPMGGELDIIDNGGDYVTLTWDEGKRSAEYYRKSVEAMIKNGTWTLTESFDDFGWVRDITPIANGDDMYTSATKGESFTIRVKEEYRNKGCSDDYLIYGAPQSSVANVVFVDATNGIDVPNGKCNTAGDGRGLLLKFNDYGGNGHEGFLATRSDSENDEVFELCNHSCWWVHPQVIEVVSDDLNENKKDDDFDWIRDTSVTFDENNTPSVGDILVCLPGYHNRPSGPYDSEQEDPQCAGAGYADGRIIVVKEVDVWPNGHEGKRLVVWPNEEESEMYWDYDDGEVCFECGIYGFALTYYTGDELMESIDSLDWIRDIDPNQPVSFHDAKIFKTYRFEGTDLLVEAVDTCGRDSGIYDRAETVIVRNSDMTPYHDVVCDTDDDRPVFSLQLEFHSKEGEYIDTFWATEEMLTLYQTYGDLNESVDEWDWIRDIDAGIIIQPNTLYFFEPKLTAEEAVRFADNIVDDADNHTYYFKDWLSSIANHNSDVRTDGGIKYFMTKPERNPIRLQSWCTQTNIDRPKSLWPGVKIVDARKEFNF